MMWTRLLLLLGLLTSLGILFSLPRSGAAPDHPEPARDLAFLRRLADAGEVSAQVLLGELHLRQGNFGEALGWLWWSAERGEVEAQLQLAQMFESGLGVARDDEQAEHWYRRATEKGNVLAHYKAGPSYAAGYVP